MEIVKKDGTTYVAIEVVKAKDYEYAPGAYSTGYYTETLYIPISEVEKLFKVFGEPIEVFDCK